MSTKALVITVNEEYKTKKVHLYETEMPNQEGRLAIALLERWGPVNSTIDGEDSSGRAIVRELTPKETVERAFDIAELTYKKLNEKNLMVEIPDLAEINS